MKKIILFVSIFLLFLTSFNCVGAVADVYITIDGTIEDYVGTYIEEVPLSISLSEGYTFNDEIIDEDLVTPWLTNLPTGLIVEINDISNETISLLISGTCNEPVDEQIEVSIPYSEDYINGAAPVEGTILTNTLSDDNKYVIIMPEIIYEYEGPYVVGSYINEELNTNTVKVKITGIDSLKTEALLEENRVLVENYNGLTSTITDYDPDDKIITITYTGLPIAEDHDEIVTIIPSSYFKYASLIEGKEISVVIPNRADVIYDINSRYIEPPHNYNPPVTGIE